MTEAVKCCLCESELGSDGGISKEVLNNHFYQDHNVVTKDKNVLRYLQLMHNEHQLLDFKTRTRNNYQSSQGHWKDKENLPTRTPFKDVSFNQLSVLSKTIGLVSDNERMPKVDLLDDEDFMSEKQVEVYSSPVRLKTSVSFMSNDENVEKNDEGPENMDENDHQTDSTLNPQILSTEQEQEGFIEGGDNSEETEVINLEPEERLKTIAQFGRYICPDPDCNFKCGAKVDIKVHVGDSHPGLLNANIRRQEMMIILDKPENLLSQKSGERDGKDYNSLTQKKVAAGKAADNNSSLNIVMRPLVEIYIKEEMEDFEELITRKRGRNDSEVSEELEELIPKKRTRLDSSLSKEEVPSLEISSQDSEEKTAREKTIEKMRLLQTGKSNGTYVQCSLKGCGKWRYLDGLEDPSSIPDTWVCRMNPDPLLNSCQKGVSEKFVENSEEFVDTQYVSGSMVWAKMVGYPWWPGMVDFCPDTDEYYWLDSWDNKPEKKNKKKNKKLDNVPTWYHVVFFDFPQVKRAWIRVEDTIKLEDVGKPPKAPSLRPCLQKKWKKILAMAGECIKLEREERLEKFSFAALFDGKWGYYDEHSKVQKSKRKVSLENIKPKEEKKILDVEPNWKPSDLLKLWNNNSGATGGSLEEWKCNVCFKFFPYVENIVIQHLKFHHMSLEEYLEKYEHCGDRSNNLGLLNWKQKKNISQLFQEKSSGSSESRSRRSLPSKVYEKPELSAESLVGLSLKFLDPLNKSGATYQEILAFITIIFPYYSDNIEECRQMIYEVYNCNPDDSTNSRVRLKPEILEKLMKRTEKQFSNCSEQIEMTLLSPRLLKRLQLDGLKCLTRKKYPECNEFLLVLLALLILRKSASVDQLAIFLSLLFPALQPHISKLKSSISELLPQGKEFFVEQVGDTKLYRLNSIEHSKSVKILEEFTKMPHNLRELKDSAFDGETLEFYLKSINKEQ